MASSFLLCYHIPFLLLLLLLLLLLHINPSSSTTNIPLGSSLSTQNGSWVSPSGDFAFGFRPLESNTTFFLLAIWFDKTPNKTIVWYANGNTPVNVGSSITLTSTGQLSLRDNTGQEVWNTSVPTASYAQLLDTGNLILASSDGTAQWQSFDSPTDTILPSQILNLGSGLQSRLSDTDYSNGRFELDMQGDGNLVFYTDSFAYWASNTAGKGSQLVFNASGTIYLAVQNETDQIFTSWSTSSTVGFYQRGTLDPDGAFRHYIYQKNGTGGGVWLAVASNPTDVCVSIQTTGLGSGVCGFNSYCKSGGTMDERVDCECPEHYSFFDENRKYKGCKPDFTAQSCDADESALFELKEMLKLNWPFFDYEIMHTSFDEGQCKNKCLSDCFCVAAVFNIPSGNCWKKRFPLTNGHMENSDQTVSLIKVPKDNSSLSQLPVAILEKKDRKTLIVVGSSVSGISVFINLLLIATVLLLLSLGKRRRKIQPESSRVGLSLRCFTFKELEEAANGFSEEVGSGAFGRVYKGYLQAEPRVCVAIKRLDRILEETEKEFANEISSIGQTHHKNLVRLLGFCSEGVERILVYEFMTNGSLTRFLFEGTRPDWNQRVRVALGIARGLLYLHEECTSQIIHCDIKPHNILLDDNFVARIADFGLAKLLRTDQTRTSTTIRGTRGYVAPEWFKGNAITTKVDVYSFGVILLEIICCRKNVVEAEEDEDASILTFWAYDCYRDGKVGLLMEGDEEALADLLRLERFVAVAIWCIQEEPSLRPTMRKVTQMLDGAVTIPPPPDPSSYISLVN